MVQELWSENQHFGMSPKYHSVPSQGAHVYTGSGESTGLDVKKHALSDEQIISRCRKCFGASSSERTARRAIILLVLCVNCVAGRIIYGICP